MRELVVILLEQIIHIVEDVYDVRVVAGLSLSHLHLDIQFIAQRFDKFEIREIIAQDERRFHVKLDDPTLEISQIGDAVTGSKSARGIQVDIGDHDNAAQSDDQQNDHHHQDELCSRKHTFSTKKT